MSWGLEQVFSTCETLSLFGNQGWEGRIPFWFFFWVERKKGYLRVLIFSYKNIIKYFILDHPSSRFNISANPCLIFLSDLGPILLLSARFLSSFTEFRQSFNLIGGLDNLVGEIHLPITAGARALEFSFIGFCDTQIFTICRFKITSKRLALSFFMAASYLIIQHLSGFTSSLALIFQSPNKKPTNNLGRFMK